MKNGNLSKRLFFTLWAIPLGWWIINADFSVIPPGMLESVQPDLTIYPGQILAMLLIILGMSEYIRMLSIRFPQNGFWVVYIWLSFQFISSFFPELAVSERFDTFLLLMLVAGEAMLWGKATSRWQRASLLFSGTVFLSIAGISLLYFYREPFQTIFPRLYEHSMLSQLGIITICGAIFLCDTAAYFVGTYFGKHHFSSISPKKTIEGSVAGLCTSILVASIGWFLWAGDKYPAFLGVILGILIGVFAQAGDLLVSLMKRYYRVKDTSSIIPGHGGILDRFDSVFFTAPVVSLYFWMIDKIIN
ncbi:MAG: hypothetical protein GF401_11935 [Chitinivibrionales bacterium]|nr:hypothetical protein [Chitinivibrionales bacterium]